MYKKTDRYIIFTIVLLLFFISGGYCVKAEDIYSLEKDGYWKPTDKVEHEFYIENTWGENCYLEGINFQRSGIKDIETNKEYTMEEAINEKIIDDKYNITIKQDNNTLYDGTITELIKKEFIPLPEPIYLKIDTKIKFQITIYFDPMAGNTYQNKNYEYLLYPQVYKIQEELLPEIELPKTGGPISSTTMAVIGITIIAIGITTLKSFKREDG